MRQQHNNKLHSNTVVECHLLFINNVFISRFLFKRNKAVNNWTLIYPHTASEAPFKFNILCIFIVLRPTVLSTSLGKTFFAWRFILNENILF